jgi:hypothetical protein
VEELFDIGCNTERWHGVEHAKGMTTFQEFMSITFVKSSSNKEDDIVDHVCVPMPVGNEASATRDEVMTYVM